MAARVYSYKVYPPSINSRRLKIPRLSAKRIYISKKKENIVWYGKWAEGIIGLFFESMNCSLPKNNPKASLYAKIIEKDLQDTWFTQLRN